MLLVQLQRIARSLLPMRAWCLWLAFTGGISAIYALAFLSNDDPLLLKASLLFTLWMLMAHAFIRLFQEIPSPVLPGLGWWERLQQKLVLWSYHLLAAGVMLVGLGLTSLSIKLWLL